MTENDVKFNKELFVQKIETRLADSYDIICEVGRGAFSKVYEIKHKNTGEIRACKYIKKENFQKEDLERFKKEIEILIKSDHPNIIKLFEIVETPKSFYLIMEKCDGGSLSNKIDQRIKTKKPYDEKILSELIYQLASAINYYHKIGICHRDLKPDNILFVNLGGMENNPLKIIDFGLGKLNKNKGKLESVVGSILYMAPEVLNGSYNEKCDIWSLGVILYTLISGVLPFLGQNDGETKMKIILMKYNIEKDFQGASEEVKDLIKHMLVKESERYSAQDILNHKWVKKEKKFPNNSEFLENNLKVYQKMDIFEKKIITFIASRLNENEIKNLTNFFNIFDKNSDGIININEFSRGISELSTKKLSKEEIEELFKNIDTNKDRKIEYTEFLASCINKDLYLNKDKLREVFEAFDKKKIGKICVEDIISVLKLDDNSAIKPKEVFRKLDTANEGKIEFDQFIKMICILISDSINK